MNLTENPHLNLKPPVNSTVYLIRGSLKYYHYNCDGFDDRGWGCGYRTLQTIFTWIEKQQELCQVSHVPCISEIQKALVDISDKPQSFIGSREWIGSLEVAYCIDYFYKVPCRIIHTRSLKDLKEHVMDIVNHFAEFGSPVMMGGDEDCSSKCILGICMCPDDIWLLILDPHYSGRTISTNELQSSGWIKWQRIDSLNHCSFYNLCCPILKAKN